MMMPIRTRTYKNPNRHRYFILIKCYSVILRLFLYKMTILNKKNFLYKKDIFYTPETTSQKKVIEEENWSSYFMRKNSFEKLIRMLRVQMNELLHDLDQISEFVHIDGARHLRVHVVQRQIILWYGINVLHKEAEDMLGLGLGKEGIKNKGSNFSNFISCRYLPHWTSLCIYRVNACPWTRISNAENFRSTSLWLVCPLWSGDHGTELIYKFCKKKERKSINCFFS